MARSRRAIRYWFCKILLLHVGHNGTSLWWWAMTFQHSKSCCVQALRGVGWAVSESSSVHGRRQGVGLLSRSSLTKCLTCRRRQSGCAAQAIWRKWVKFVQLARRTRRLYLAGIQRFHSSLWRTVSMRRVKREQLNNRCAPVCVSIPALPSAGSTFHRFWLSRGARPVLELRKLARYDLPRMMLASERRCLRQAASERLNVSRARLVPTSESSEPKSVA